MAQYINKDALLVEIDKLFQQHSSKEYIDEAGCVLDKLEDIIDTLEVKEVDLDTDFGVCWGEYCDCGGNINDYKIAKHFFELGLNASNPLAWEDVYKIRQIMFDYNRQIREKAFIPNNEDYCKEVLKRFKIEKEKDV